MSSDDLPPGITKKRIQKAVDGMLRTMNWDDLTVKNISDTLAWKARAHACHPPRRPLSCTPRPSSQLLGRTLSEAEERPWRKVVRAAAMAATPRIKAEREAHASAVSEDDAEAMASDQASEYEETSDDEEEPSPERVAELNAQLAAAQERVEKAVAAAREAEEKAAAAEATLQAAELHLACCQGETAKVREMLGKGVASDIPSKRDGETPLRSSAIGGHAECAQLLIDAGAAVDRPDSDGNSPHPARVELALFQSAPPRAAHARIGRMTVRLSLAGFSMPVSRGTPSASECSSARVQPSTTRAWAERARSWPPA